MKPLLDHVKLVIFDVDGTLVETMSGAPFRKSADDWKWLPGRLEALWDLHKKGIKTAIATNQGGVAFGYMQESDVYQALLDLGYGNNFDTMQVCFTHPKASIDRYRLGDTRRKPSPGMILEIQQELYIGSMHTLMVGDRPEDEQAAQNAGVAFMWSEEFFQ